ncbi:uncharacterized protein LOC134236633 [Saccostrea cucullata]|uniref:uncharacterized protein LOC134236633 n=1 Tax=Saccostrea cuccullata TaxID=36930 RepID=UPI002ECFD1AA
MSSAPALSASQSLPPLNQTATGMPPVALTSQPNLQTAAALSTEKTTAAASSLTSLLDTVFAGSQGEGSSPGPSANSYPLSSLADLNLTTCSILAASLSASSRAAYRQSWNLFQTMDKGASSLPLSLQSVCNFIGYLFDKQYSASSIASHVSALSYLHKLLNLPDPTQTFIVRKLLKGCSRLLPSQDTRLPITKEILHKLINANKMTVSQPLNQLLLKALYLLCFNAFLRLGEVVVKSVADRDRVLQVQDVTFHGDGNLPHSVQIVIRHHKTQKKNDPLIVSIQGGSGEFCPVQAMHEYCKKSSHSSGPFFQFVDGTPVTYSFVSSQLSKAISFAGFDPKRFKGHSFRIGAATHAAQLGYSESCIQHLGRWNSNALHRYIRIKSFEI